MVKLEMQGITLAYGDKKVVVVEDVTFQVMPGEMVGLVGPNGSGKSTIIKALSRVITPDRCCSPDSTSAQSIHCL